MFHGAKAEKEFVMLRLVTSGRECKHVDYHTEIHDGRFNEMKLFMFCKSLNKLQKNDGQKCAHMGVARA